MHKNFVYICQQGQEGEADRTTDYERNAFGQVTCLSMLKDWLGETIIERDQLGDPVRITDHAGRSVSYEWGAYGERKAMTYPDGTIVGYGYDEGLRLAKLERYHKEKEALCITYRYDKAGRLAEKEDSGGYRTSWHYNGLNQLEELIHEDSRGILDQYSYSYDAMGNKTGIRKERNGRPEESGSYVARKDRNGNTDTFSHNKKGQLIQVKGANGGELFYSYNREGKLISVRDHAGREIGLRYRYGKLYQYVNPAGHTYTYAYNEDGKLESVTTPRKIVGVKNTYDGAGRVVKQEMPDGGKIELLYDDENNRTYQKEPNGNLIVYESDERFRNVSTIYEDGEEIYAYNDKNQTVSRIMKEMHSGR